MFKKVILPTTMSMILIVPISIFIFWFFNGFVEYISTGDGRPGGQQFLIENVADTDEPDTNDIDALDFTENYINPMIIFTFLFQNILLLLWLILGKFLKVNKPGIAKNINLFGF